MSVYECLVGSEVTASDSEPEFMAKWRDMVEEVEVGGEVEGEERMR